MNPKTLLLAAGILAGAAVVYLAANRAKKADDPAASKPAATLSGGSTPVLNPRPAKDSAPAPIRREASPRSAIPGAASPLGPWARLAEKYGPERTAHSGKITADLAEVIEVGMDLADAGARNSGSASIAEAAAKGTLRRMTTQLGLTEDQQEEASGLIGSAVAERMSAVTELATAMRSEPEHMMELLLAGDALSRNEIPQDEYDKVTLETRTMLQNLGGFAMGGPGAAGGAQLLGNEEVARKLNAILTPEQQAKLAEITAKATEQAQARQARAGNTGMPFQNGQIPVMDLERMDQSVTSVKKMEEAARLMMEAMKDFKEANPTPINP